MTGPKEEKAEVLGGIRLGECEWFNLYLNGHQAMKFWDSQVTFEIKEIITLPLTCYFVDADNPIRIVGTKEDIRKFLAEIRPAGPVVSASD